MSYVKDGGRGSFEQSQDRRQNQQYQREDDSEFISLERQVLHRTIPRKCKRDSYSDEKQNKTQAEADQVCQQGKKKRPGPTTPLVPFYPTGFNKSVSDE